MSKYAIGLDFGTESARIVVVDIATGVPRAERSVAYPHGVLSDALPTGERLGEDWALQHPDDYLFVLETLLPSVLKDNGISGSDIVGIGVDFTSCTVLPIDERGRPLCFDDRWTRRPHSWPKLWKHHAAWREAEEITRLAADRHESFLPRYGGRISSEWAVPKLLQILNEDESVYHATDRFVEAGDWLVSVLVGRLARNAGGAGFKAMWHKAEGYPSNDFFRALHVDFEHVVATKLRGDIVPVGDAVGGLTTAMAEKLGLVAGTPVAAAVIDAFAAVPGLGIAEPGKMVLALGTSTCHMLLADREAHVEGMTGVVRDGVIPGYFGYEAGQAAVGDIFGWFVDHAVPPYVHEAARNAGQSVFEFLEKKAARLRPGESGMVALDWWNGNRSVLSDAALSGAIIGYTLASTPAEVYRTLLEATAFGTRKIVEQFERAGLTIDSLHVGGGIAQRNRLLMQIYADVIGKPVYVPSVRENVALGAAMFGACAAAGGGQAMFGVIRAMAKHDQSVYEPNPTHREMYDRLYGMYTWMHDVFGREHRDVMHDLRSFREGGLHG